jgi:hypothetical protein
VPVLLAVVVVWQERRRRARVRMELRAGRPAEAPGG